jgi:hypothetical protein
MKMWLCITLFTSVTCLPACAQFRDTKKLPSYSLKMPEAPTLKKLPFGLREDAAQTVSYASPALYTLPAADAQHQFQTQWVSSVSSLSFNNGKFGSYYYWDIRGNLVDTRGFIDIAGRNKRGLKIVFPWR